VGFELREFRQMRGFLQQKIEDSQFKDFCTQFKFDFFADNEEFNERFNFGDNWKFLYNDRTREFFHDIGKVIDIGSNVIIFIYGSRNMGKSEVAQRVALEYKRMFKTIKRRDIKHYIGFSDGEMAKIFPQMKKGEFAIRDESPYISGEGRITVQKNLQNICNITRGYQVSFIFINPYVIEQEGIDYYLEVAGKDIENRLIRCLLYDRRHLLRGVVYIKLHEDDQLRQEYLKQKEENILRLMANAGGQYTGTDTERLLDHSIRLYNYCFKRGASSKTNIRTYLTNYNNQFKEGDANAIHGTAKYIDQLIDNVYLALNGESSILDEYLENKELEELSQQVSGFDFRPNNSIEEEAIEEVELEAEEVQSEFIDFLTAYYEKKLPDFVEISEKTNITKEDAIDILSMWAYGIGIREIGFSMENLHQGIIQDTLKLFKTGKRRSAKIPDDWRVYKCYEYWIAYKLNAKIISGHRKPDLQWEIMDDKLFGECKLWDDIKKNIALDKFEKFNIFKFNIKTSSFPIFFRNVKWGDVDYVMKADREGDNIINFQPLDEFILNGEFDIKDYYREEEEEEN